MSLEYGFRSNAEREADALATLAQQDSDDEDVSESSTGRSANSLATAEPSQASAEQGNVRETEKERRGSESTDEEGDRSRIGSLSSLSDGTNDDPDYKASELLDQMKNATVELIKIHPCNALSDILFILDTLCIQKSGNILMKRRVLVKDGTEDERSLRAKTETALMSRGLVPIVRTNMIGNRMAMKVLAGPFIFGKIALASDRADVLDEIYMALWERREPLTRGVFPRLLQRWIADCAIRPPLQYELTKSDLRTVMNSSLICVVDRIKFFKEEFYLVSSEISYAIEKRSGQGYSVDVSSFMESSPRKFRSWGDTGTTIMSVSDMLPIFFNGMNCSPDHVMHVLTGETLTFETTVSKNELTDSFWKRRAEKVRRCYFLLESYVSVNREWLDSLSAEWTEDCFKGISADKVSCFDSRKRAKGFA